MSDRSAEIDEGRGHLCAIPHERRGCAMCERDQLKARVQELEALVNQISIYLSEYSSVQNDGFVVSWLNKAARK